MNVLSRTPDSAVYDDRYTAGSYRERLTGHEIARSQALGHFVTRVLQIADARTVLDYGAGIGLYLPVCKRLFPSATLAFCDVSPTARERFAAKYPRHADEYRLVQAEGAEFSEGAFDVIVSVEVMEHVPDLAAYMRDVFRLLKPGGTFVWTTPCANAWSIEQVLARVTRQIDSTAEGYRRWRWEDETHLRRLTSAEAAAALRQHGFTDVRFRFRAHLFSFFCSHFPLPRRLRRTRNLLMTLDYHWFRLVPNGASMIGAATKPRT